MSGEQDYKVKLLTQIKKIALDTLFPVHCISCGAFGQWICEDCFSRIKIHEQQLCPRCEKIIMPQGKNCEQCKKSGKCRLDGLLTAVSYKNSPVKRMIFSLKYRFVRDLADPLAKLMTKAIITNDFPVPGLIVPVPLHPRRLRWRGFNQAGLLAENISVNLAPPLAIPVLDILERKKHNKPQMKIRNYQERLKNVENAFRIKRSFSGSEIKGKIILLLDDIATTGATLEECAKALKENGAKKVFAAVVARQSIK